MHPIPRDRIVAVARSWIGTPYHHQASTKGVGTDCLGLIRGIWRDLYVDEPEALPAYTRDWAEAQNHEPLLDAARRHLVERAPDCASPGDVLVFRWRANAPGKHVGILAASTRLVHATEGLAVTEIKLSPWWHRRCIAAFAYPGVEI